MFGDDIWLLNRKLVKELQDKWAEEEIEALKQQGYDKVEILPQDDWQTLQNTVEVTGRISAEVRATLACYLKADHYGLIVVHKNRISRKKVDDKGKIKKKAQSADETPAENVKPMVCTELTPAQQEIVNGLAASDLYRDVITGNTLLAQFLVIDRVFGDGIWTEGNDAFKHNGTLSRWGAADQGLSDRESDQYHRDRAGWPERSEELRLRRFLESHGAPTPGRHIPSRLCCPDDAALWQPGTEEGPARARRPTTGWCPASDFFKRYRTDQLIDYRKRSGDREAGETVKKKGDHVADCVVAAATPGAFKLDLYPQKTPTPAVRKKRKVAEPDEA